jgi:3-phenylpropionate/trans-cinnamate dioxygenase ferredoxin reductase subunit
VDREAPSSETTLISSQKAPLVIVGASYAGTHLAAAAREQGFDGAIVLIGDEPHAPYQRPPLSKGLLTGKTGMGQLALRGPDFYTQQGIDLRVGQRATALDLAARRVRLADGDSLEYGWLALATGARCRPLSVPGAELQGVHQLRTLDDALAVQRRLGRCSNACIVGGGFIGLEVAAALISAGARVTVVESQTRLLARAFPAFMSDYVAEAHRQRGVSLELGRSVRALLGRQGRVEAVQFDDGRTMDCDLVVAGIGVLPNTELADAAGIACNDGILVDALGRTSVPNVLAVGDVANMAQPPFPGSPARMRFESIQAASDGARAAASVLIGRPEPLSAVPWFWSEQHDLRFQMAGLPASGDRVVLRGVPASDRFTAFYLRDDVVTAAHSVNRPSDHVLARKLIAQRSRIPAAALADPTADLKSMIDAGQVN